MVKEQAPQGVNPLIPNAARMYDYFIGGKDNFQADRELAEMVLSVLPETRDGALENRRLIGRVVEYLVGKGVTQFLDLGSGLPAQQNVHEVAQRLTPDARVVYVDQDTVVCTHGRALLAGAGGEGVAMVQGDVRVPESILGNPEVRALIDFDRPVAVLMMFLLHLIDDADDPWSFVAAYREAVAPGSYLAVSHVGSDAAPERTARISEFYRKANTPFCPRTGEEIARFFGDFELIPPGLVNGRMGDGIAPFSDPDRETEMDEEMARMGYVGIARKP